MAIHWPGEMVSYAASPTGAAVGKAAELAGRAAGSRMPLILKRGAAVLPGGAIGAVAEAAGEKAGAALGGSVRKNIQRGREEIRREAAGGAAGGVILTVLGLGAVGLIYALAGPKRRK